MAERKAKIAELVAEAKQGSARVQRKAAEFDTGLVSDRRANVIIPGRGLVSVPVPKEGILFYQDDDGGHCKDFTGITQGYSKGINGKTYDFLEYEGVITKTKYLMLVRLGCSFQNGRIVAPREKSAMVRELLVGKK